MFVLILHLLDGMIEVMMLQELTMLSARPTDTYKVSITYFNGFNASSQLTISGPDVIKKQTL